MKDCNFKREKYYFDVDSEYYKITPEQEIYYKLHPMTKWLIPYDRQNNQPHKKNDPFFFFFFWYTVYHRIPMIKYCCMRGLYKPGLQIWQN